MCTAKTLPSFTPLLRLGVTCTQTPLGRMITASVSITPPVSLHFAFVNEGDLFLLQVFLVGGLFVLF